MALFVVIFPLFILSLCLALQCVHCGAIPATETPCGILFRSLALVSAGYPPVLEGLEGKC